MMHFPQKNSRQNFFMFHRIDLDEGDFSPETGAANAAAEILMLLFFYLPRSPSCHQCHLIAPVVVLNSPKIIFPPSLLFFIWPSSEMKFENSCFVALLLGHREVTSMKMHL